MDAGVQYKHRINHYKLKKPDTETNTNVKETKDKKQHKNEPH
jgi:hypothetical protein